MRREFSKQCTGRGCDRPVIARGFCRRHYLRWYKHNDPEAGRTARGEPMRWLKSQIAFDGEDCLTWPFNRNTRGYGTVGRHNASRVMCELVHGPAPSRSHDAAHSCGLGHKGCVHPKHLRWATKKENQADRYIHGTLSKGPAS